MQRLKLLVQGAVAAALIAFIGAEAAAQRRPIVRPPINQPIRRALPVQNVILVEEEVAVEGKAEAVEPAKEAPAATPEPKPEPREPYAIGKSYASLPGGCMKLIQDGVSYFNCSGDWYQPKNGGYVAVNAP